MKKTLLNNDLSCLLRPSLRWEASSQVLKVLAWMPACAGMTALALCLTSCAPKLPLTQELPNHAWQADGVFGYKENGKGFTAGYIWQNTQTTYVVQLIGPLGAWRAKLYGDAHHATLAISDGRIFTANRPEKLMQENLGWSIPVVNLRDWMCHLPNPALPAKVIRDKNGVTQIQQSGWTITYPDASRILLTQENKRITVVIEHFKS